MYTQDAYVPGRREIAARNRWNAREFARSWQTVSVSDLLKPGLRDQLISDWLAVREYDDELGGF